jgi:hypothetical protein
MRKHAVVEEELAQLGLALEEASQELHRTSHQRPAAPPNKMREIHGLHALAARLHQDA